MSALSLSDRNDVGELNFQGHTETETDSRNMTKYLTAGNTSEQPAEQTLTKFDKLAIHQSPPPRLKQYVLHCTGRAR